MIEIACSVSHLNHWVTLNRDVHSGLQWGRLISQIPEFYLIIIQTCSAIRAVVLDGQHTGSNTSGMTIGEKRR